MMTATAIQRDSAATVRANTPHATSETPAAATPPTRRTQTASTTQHAIPRTANAQDASRRTTDARTTNARTSDARTSDARTSDVQKPATIRSIAGPAREAFAVDSRQTTTDSLQASGLVTTSRHNLEQALPYPLFGTADSLRTIIAGRTQFRDAPAEEVFGPSSILVPSQTVFKTTTHSLSDNALFQGFVLLLAVVYATLIYHHINDIRVLMTRILRGTAAGERIATDHGNNINPFINIATAIGILFVGIVAVKSTDILLPSSMIAALPIGAALGISLGVSALLVIMACYQVAVVRGAGVVTLSQPFVVQLMMIKRTYFTLMVVAISPILLCLALTPLDRSEGWLYVIAFELLIALFLYLRDTLNLFISKKISILHWFLYLCTVDIFPFSLIWLLAGR